LRSGNAGRALALLERARREFPRGTLAQEREALSIEALAASGQTKVAAERARRFLDAHPSSMHAARVRSFARTP
jgi:outer membrane protein assembly factor BamD (BamD/ComL family)